MAKPTTRVTFEEYCLRALGHPVIEVNLDEDQMSDRIDEAIQFYQEYHGDAIVRNLLKHQVQQVDIDNGYITIQDSANILSINNVFNISNNSGGTNLFSVDYQIHLNDLFDLNGASGGIVNYELTKQYLSLMDRNISGVYEMIEFSRHKNLVNFHSDTLTQVGVGNYVVFDGYSVITPHDGSSGYADVWNDMFLKKYCTALFKRQWGTNLKKFTGMQLPGGVEINGQQIYDEASEEIREMEEQMQLKYEMPPLDFIG